MSELKTKQNDNSVHDYIESIEIDQRKKDCFQLLEVFTELTGQSAKIWGKDIVGFGSYRYKGKSGREGEWFPLGFSSRKQHLTIYMPAGFTKFSDILEGIGKHKTSAGCLYIKTLSDIDLDKLKKLATETYTWMINHQSTY